MITFIEYILMNFFVVLYLKKDALPTTILTSFYSDDDHLSEKGFVSLNKIILEKIKIIENLKN